MYIKDLVLKNPEELICYKPHQPANYLTAEFVAAKLNLNLAFFIFISLNKNLYILYYVLKYNIYIAFRTNAQACSQKNTKSLL